VTYGVKAQSITGSGVIDASSINADTVCIDDVESGTVICKRLIAKQLTVSLSSAQYPFQLLAVSRPVDISPLLSELSATLTSSSDVKQKELLKQEIVEMGAFALSGEVVERQFYIKIWDRVSDGVERDLLQKLKLLGGYFSDIGIQTEILQQQDIVRLCNLVNNPAYVHLEDSGINAAIPILESVGVV